MTFHELAVILILLIGAALIWSIVRGGSRRPTPKPIGKVVPLDGFQKLGYQLAVQGRPTAQDMRALLPQLRPVTTGETAIQAYWREYADRMARANGRCESIEEGRR